MAGNATIGALKVVLGLDSAQFETGLKQAKSGLAGFAKAGAITGGVVAGALVGAATAMSVALRGAINNADELSKTAQKVGVTVEALSRLKYAAELSDVSLDGLSNGLKKLAVNMAAVAGGEGDKAAAAFAALGINVRDASGALKSSDQVLTEVAGKFGTLQDGAAKTALAVALFGKSGSDLIPLLNSGADGLAEMAAEADALGVTLDSKTAASAEAFNDNLTRLKTVTTGITTQLAADMLPALEGISNAMVAAAKNGDFLRGVGATLNGTLKILASTAVVVGAVFAELAFVLASTINAALRALVGDFKGAQAELAWGGKGMVDTFKGSAAALQSIWSATGAKVKASAPQVSDDLAAPIVQGAGKVRAAAKAIKTDAEKAGDALRQYIKAENENFANRGKSAEQVKMREAQAKAAEALAQGLSFEAAQLLRIADGYNIVEIKAVKANDASGDFIDGLDKATPKALSGLDEMQRALDEMADRFYDARSAVDDLFYGIKNNDWVGAFSGLFKALQQVQAAFSATGTTSDKVGAVAGVGAAAGSAIGGKGGAAISGAFSGAATGFAIAGPIGAGIGAIVGGLSGFFGASKAKKRAKKEAAARAKAEAEQKAAELAAASRALDIALMRAQGKELEALAAEREDELAAADETLRARMKELYALEDQAEAEAKLAAIREQQQSVARELLRMTDAAAAADADRADILATLPESLRPLQEAYWAVTDAQDALTRAQDAQAEAAARVAEATDNARDTLIDSYERERDALTELHDTLKGVFDGIAAVLDELNAGALTDANPGQARAAAEAAFRAVAGKTDAASLAALPDAARGFLDALRQTATDPRAFARGQAEVRRALVDGQAAAAAQVSEADRQLQALHDQVAATGILNETMVSVRDALAAYNAAILDGQALQAQALADVAAAMAAVSGAIAAATAVANDNAAAIATGGLDTAAVTDALTTTADLAATTLAPDPAVAPLTSVEAMPVLISIAKTLARQEELAQLTRDELDAAA